MGQKFNKLSDKNHIDSSDFADAKDYNHVWSIEIANVTKNDQLYSLKHSVSTRKCLASISESIHGDA